jgi:hypothetical protein
MIVVTANCPCNEWLVLLNPHENASSLHELTKCTQTMELQQVKGWMSAERAQPTLRAQFARGFSALSGVSALALHPEIKACSKSLNSTHPSKCEESESLSILLM